MLIKQFFLVLRTLLTVVGMVVSLLWRFRYAVVLLMIAGATYFYLSS